LFLNTNERDILGTLAIFFEKYPSEDFIVGGFVRDSFSNTPSRDIDIATTLNPEEIGPQLAKTVGGKSFVLNSERHITRISGTYATGDKWQIDLTHITNGINENLSQRDFTINSMAVPLAQYDNENWSDIVIDPQNGLTDLFNNTLRCMNKYVFQQDGLRILRGVRLANKLKLRIEPTTSTNMRASAKKIEQVSPERLRDEFLYIMASDSTRSQLEILDRLDVLCRIIPELTPTKGVDQPNVHYWDVWGHSIHAVETAELATAGHHNSAIYSLVPWTEEIESHFNEVVSDGHNRKTILKLTALLHDIAKPQTKTTDESGKTRFLGHSEQGAEISTNRLLSLRMSTNGVRMINKMIEQHLRPTNMSHEHELPTPKAIYRYYRDLKDVAIDTLYLAIADYLAAKGPEVMPDDWARHARMVAHILQTGSGQKTLNKPNRLLTGKDLIREFQLTPGPQIGHLLDKIYESQAAGEIKTTEDALSLAAQYLSNNKQR
jgi:poly(A) polymerase